MHCGMEASKASGGQPAAPPQEKMPKNFKSAASMREWLNHKGGFGRLLGKRQAKPE